MFEACCGDQAPPQHLKTNTGEKGEGAKETQPGRVCLTPEHRTQRAWWLPSIPAALGKGLCRRQTSAPGNRKAAPAPQGDT